MNDYSGYKNGSEWRRWDLHMHTPGTLKNDQFTGSSIEEKWTNYIDDINNYTSEVSVVGITDYNSIDNYLKFKENISSGRITKRFDLVLPNVELRISPVTGSSTPINIHCLFNPIIDHEIVSRFFSKLKFSHGNTSYSGERSELVRLGRAYKDDTNLDEDEALKVGAGQFVISLDVLREVFKNDPNLRENTLIVVSNSSNDGASGLNHSNYFVEGGSQLDSTRQSIYQLCDGIFSSNQSDINYFLGDGPDKKEDVIKKCRGLKPCYHGCDAHDNSKIFNPDQNRYCWIKADPTFEGLKQTTYEPEARVKIQSLIPDIKSERHVISKVSFAGENELFGNQIIHLNDNLNAIIGGKSSGKSLLLYSVANSIDPSQVKRASEKLNFDGYNFDANFDFEVEWKDGEKDILSNKNPEDKTRKITYIPQLYINYLAEKHNKDQLNELIKSILLQDPEFKTFNDEKADELQTINVEIDRQVNIMVELRKKYVDLNIQRKEIGTSNAIKESISKIEESIKEGTKLSNLTDEEEKKFKELSKQKEDSEELDRALKDESLLINKIKSEFDLKERDLLGMPSNDVVAGEKGSLDRLIDDADYHSDLAFELKEIISKGFLSIKEALNKKILEQNVKGEIAINQKSLDEVIKQLIPFEDKLKNRKDVIKLTQTLGNERAKLIRTESMERQLVTFLEDFRNSKRKLGDLIQNRIELYESITTHINTFNRQIGEDITLGCNLEYRKDDFDFFHQVNKAAIAADNSFHDFFLEETVDYSRIPDFIRNIKKFGSDSIGLSDDTVIKLNNKVEFKQVLEGLSKDAYHLDYVVTYKNDDLLNMSPGKKGTVLLILFLQISSNEYPILIDQPEDNLDNRTIYELLCKIIREKKKNRQIIIVSHNANLVVSTDAENIVVANQEGQDPNRRKSEYQFEYVNGALEHSFPFDENINGILFQQGVREHVCDILEGGNEAFKQRERKYSLK